MPAKTNRMNSAFGFYYSEINGAVLAGLPLIIIICNGGAWGTEKHGQIVQLGEVVNCELGHMVLWWSMSLSTAWPD